MPPTLEEIYRKHTVSGLLWDKAATGNALRNIRKNNVTFKKFVCKHARLYKYTNDQTSYYNDNYACPNSYSCDLCEDYYRDISYGATARALLFEDPRSIRDLERGKNVTFDKILLYAYVASVPISEIIQLSSNNNYEFQNNIIVRTEQTDN